ncbi:MAG: PTS sugar transporter subunit IIA [Lachnospiraceae bacterium]|nr:PTS sugar transporter subunit IIA [Lachnospiraceae bacterium]
MGLVKLENVKIYKQADDWREAIRISVKPLEDGGYVKSCYKDEIIGNVEKLGPYFLIADDIAMPHARPEQGTIETQIGITLFREGVQFDGKESTARLFVTLAAKDNDSHLEALVKISELLSDEAMVEDILTASDEQALYQYFERI